jgi:hypothetical protein
MRPHTAKPFSLMLHLKYSVGVAEALRYLGNMSGSTNVSFTLLPHEDLSVISYKVAHSHLSSKELNENQTHRDRHSAFIPHTMVSKNGGDCPNPAGKQTDPKSGQDQLDPKDFYLASSEPEEQASAPSSNSRSSSNTAGGELSSLGESENEEKEELARYDREGAPSPEPLPPSLRSNLGSQSSLLEVRAHFSRFFPREYSKTDHQTASVQAVSVISPFLPFRWSIGSLHPLVKLGGVFRKSPSILESINLHSMYKCPRRNKSLPEPL